MVGVPMIHLGLIELLAKIGDRLTGKRIEDDGGALTVVPEIDIDRPHFPGCAFSVPSAGTYRIGVSSSKAVLNGRLTQDGFATFSADRSDTLYPLVKVLSAIERLGRTEVATKSPTRSIIPSSTTLTQSSIPVAQDPD
jgi:hypothetical protein